MLNVKGVHGIIFYETENILLIHLFQKKDTKLNVQKKTDREKICPKLSIEKFLFDYSIFYLFCCYC